jgi:hypothetical protein
MAVNLPNNPANGDSVLLNGTTYVYNSTNNSWDIPVGAGLTLPLTSLSVGAEGTPSGDGAISYDNTTGIFTYTPPVISGGSGITAYANTTDLPTSEVTTGAMAYVSANNKLYLWNGTAWFNIAIVNQAPTAITGNQATYVLATDGTPTVVTLVSTDPEGLPLTWSSSTSGDTQVGTLSQTDNVFTITPSTDEANIGTLSVTFSVTDGNNTETSVSSFTLEFVSPYWNETVLSIGTSSTNGLANNTFIDRSTNAHTVTPAGTPVQTAFHPYLDNWSVEFDGSGDYIRKSGSGVLTSSEDVTIECWAYPLSSSVIGLFDGGSGQQSILRNYPSNVVGNSHGNRISFTMVPNAWNHFALTVTTGASGGNATCYINGTSVGTAAFGAYVGGNNFDIGIINAGYGAGDGNFNGYVSNFRVTKSIVYNQNFTPPTEKLTAITGTTLLTCQSNRFVDNGSNAHTITPTGNVKVSAFNPFGQGSEYAAGENKGSVRMIQTNTEFLVTPQLASLSSTLLANNFTIEAWVYLEEYASVGASHIWNNTQTHLDYQTALYIYPNGRIMVGKVGVNEFGSVAGTIKLNVWHHVAIVGNGATTRIYVDGADVANGASSTYLNSSNVTHMKIGRSSQNSGDNSFPGYISDFKVTPSAVYTSAFTPPTAPVGSTNASLYLPMDNAGIFDKTGNNTLTPVGNASTSTTQTKYADTAMYFDGTGDYLRVPYHVGLVMGSSNFTIECWVYPTVLAGDITVFAAHTADANGGYAVGFNGTLARTWMNFSGSWLQVTGPAVSLNTWNHIAVVRDGSSFYMYTNGVRGTVFTNGGAVTSTANSDVTIGARYNGTSNYYTGYLENPQFLKGVAKYTANFTPPNRTQGITYQAES